MISLAPFTFFASLEPQMQAALGLALLLLAAVAARLLALWIIAPSLQRLRLHAGAWPMEILLHEGVLHRLARLLPWLVVSAGVVYVPHLNARFATVLSNIALAFIAIQIVAALMAMLDALLSLQEKYSREKGDQASAHKVRSIKSYVQLGKLMLILAGAIVSVALLLDRSPLIVLSGLGAMSAVLMLVFKDTILSFTAGVQLSSNDMLRIGDWIEMPQVGADGDVIDIALHTVKVQNWDKTITTIPTWRLMSESYRNWRGMSESGGRRIKRTLRIDVNSVRFLDAEQMAYFSNFALLQDYMQAKRTAVEQTNAAARAALGERVELTANQRHLTNIGTFRAYVLAYLQAHPDIHQDMTLMVRTLEPTAEGVPLEVYCFTATTKWAVYEGIQGDIFDHLLAVLPEFGLRLYQHPSGHDFRASLPQGNR
ncbi:MULTISPECIES: mechanosensitive ion channel family protein [unclassified Simplicispira]|uniref:mechanosensitive ion channel family protein n=1 Tax=unclassified Simplicispira TaxID=2630407 RepID=UPI000D5FC48D|nr:MULTISPECIES: mechanosensitive ion channel family protein [unclassified Simplicispira]PVY56480.1 miniconductance mechanosensitive channel [Simplicispira sp. 125]REG17425.1 miniconductance mechanosensitive channel [Simplicispira sp. 110]